MDYIEATRINRDLQLVGFRAHASTVGLLQLIKELRASENLSEQATKRIRDAMIDDLALSRATHEKEGDFRKRLQARLDCLLDLNTPPQSDLV